MLDGLLDTSRVGVRRYSQAIYEMDSLAGGFLTRRTLC